MFVEENSSMCTTTNPEPARFVQVYPEQPTAGANSGGIGCNEQDEQFWKDNLNPRYDQDTLDFISKAKVGEYIQSRLFLFRTK